MSDEYKKYEFCKAMCCEKLKNKCTVSAKDCIFTAKQLHKWCKNEGIMLIRESMKE
ncbi:MAG TPA: hypothetical protein VMV43_05915 [Candidatus Nanopelagicaceae bacterium]|nr:hypothetical protein [Candidatus Nanopelagicaceae bacterium]